MPPGPPTTHTGMTADWATSGVWTGHPARPPSARKPSGRSGSTDLAGSKRAGDGLDERSLLPTVPRRHAMRQVLVWLGIIEGGEPLKLPCSYRSGRGSGRGCDRHGPPLPSSTAGCSAPTSCRWTRPPPTTYQGCVAEISRYRRAPARRSSIRRSMVPTSASSGVDSTWPDGMDQVLACCRHGHPRFPNRHAPPAGST